MKRATGKIQLSAVVASISIHALMKRATIPDRERYGGDEHFNPRPHEEGDQVLNASWDKIFISIHALMKRATRIVRQAKTHSLFQSTPS